MKTLAAILLLSAIASAQATQNAKVKGTVHNGKRDPMPGVVVLLENRFNGFIRTATTGADGSFSITGIPPADHYKLSVATMDGTGFDERNDISLKAGDNFEVLPPMGLRPDGLKGKELKASELTTSKELSVTYKGDNLIDISSKPHEQIKYTSPHDKSEHTYSCVSLATVLAGAGVPQGEKLRGNAMMLIVVASANDNYHSVFSLAELDEGMGTTKAYVCDADGGKPLGENEAPLKLLVTTDKRPARSVRMLTGLEVKSAQ